MGKILPIKLAVLEYGAIYCEHWGINRLCLERSLGLYGGLTNDNTIFIDTRLIFAVLSIQEIMYQGVAGIPVFFFSAIPFSGDHKFHPCRQLPHHLQLNYQ